MVERPREGGKVTEAQVAWAAGFFEGEGTFYAKAAGPKRKDGTRRKSLKLSLSNTDLSMLRQFKAYLGDAGSITQLRAARPNRQQIFQWSCVTKQARNVAALLYPYLSERRKQQLGNAGGLTL